MAACLSMFSLRTIRTLFEKNNVPFELRSDSPASLASKAPAARAAASAGPNIVALVDSFGDLPKEVQSYLLTAGDVSGDSPDRVKAVIVGGRGGAQGGGGKAAAQATKKGAAKSGKKSRKKSR
jgi:hypothetical protein